MDGRLSKTLIIGHRNALVYENHEDIEIFLLLNVTGPDSEKFSESYSNSLSRAFDFLRFSP